MSLARKYCIVPTSSPWVSEDEAEDDLDQLKFDVFCSQINLIWLKVISNNFDDVLFEKSLQHAICGSYFGQNVLITR